MDYNQDLNEILARFADHTTDPHRPFTGQPQTEQGERGKTEIKNIRIRDLADSIAKALVDATAGDTPEIADEMRARAEDGTLNYNDLYKLDLSKMDPIALIKRTMGRVEKAMGIYPNIPPKEEK